MMAFLNGAGSIRAYPHAENTGLVISDVAKIGTIFQKCKFLRDFLLNEPFEPLDWSRTRGTGPCLTLCNVGQDDVRSIDHSLEKRRYNAYTHTDARN